MKAKNKAFFRLKQLNEDYDRILTQISQIHDDELQRKPAPEKWSVVQICNHLFEIERLNLDYVTYKQENNSNYPKEKLVTKLKLFVYLLALSSPLKFKVPAKFAPPTEDGDLDMIQNKFAQLRAEYHTFIENQDDSYFTKATCKHVLVGRLTFANMLKFLRSHMKHHEKQILRTLISISKQN